MSLPRMDIKGKLDADKHAQLKAICAADDVTVGAFIEALLLQVIAKRVHDAVTLADALQAMGAAGNNRARAGKPGNGRELHAGGAN
jgi:hypothetical protein